MLWVWVERVMVRVVRVQGSMAAVGTGGLGGQWWWSGWRESESEMGMVSPGATAEGVWRVGRRWMPEGLVEGLRVRRWESFCVRVGFGGEVVAELELCVVRM